MNKLGTIAIELMASSALGSRTQLVHLLPAGTFHGRDGRGPYKVVDAGAVILESREHAGRRQMPVDYDHQIDHAEHNGKPAPAAGWIKALQAKPDGIWGLVDWTERAADQLSKREYRYLSPVFHHQADGTVTRLLRAALTNNPNLDQLTALATTENREMEKPAELRTLLGLPDDASEDDVLAKVRELTTARHAAAPDPSKFVPIGDFERVVTEVNKLNKGISLQAATDHVVLQITHGKMPTFLKEWGIALCSVNKPAFDAFIDRTKGLMQRIATPIGASAAAPQATSLHSSRGLSDDELAIASNLGVSPDAFLKTKQARETREGV
jgi:phage I-like protein